MEKAAPFILFMLPKIFQSHVVKAIFLTDDSFGPCPESK